MAPVGPRKPPEAPVGIPAYGRDSTGRRLPLPPRQQPSGHLRRRAEIVRRVDQPGQLREMRIEHLPVVAIRIERIIGWGDLGPA